MDPTDAEVAVDSAPLAQVIRDDNGNMEPEPSPVIAAAVSRLSNRPIGTLRLARAYGQPLGRDIGLLREPIRDILVWISLVQDAVDLHAWYRLIPLFHPDTDGLTIAVGEFDDRAPASFFRKRTWSIKDPESLNRMGSTIEHELPNVANQFEDASSWAANAIPDEHDYDDFPDLAESLGYARFLAGSAEGAAEILARLTRAEHTIATRSRDMLAMMHSDPDRAHRQLAAWRAMRLSRLGLTGPSGDDANQKSLL